MAFTVLGAIGSIITPTGPREKDIWKKFHSGIETLTTQWSLTAKGFYKEKASSGCDHVYLIDYHIFQSNDTSPVCDSSYYLDYKEEGDMYYWIIYIILSVIIIFLAHLSTKCSG